MSNVGLAEAGRGSVWTMIGRVLSGRRAAAHRATALDPDLLTEAMRRDLGFLDGRASDARMRRESVGTSRIG